MTALLSRRYLFSMRKSIFAVIVGLSIVASTQGQQGKPQAQQPPAPRPAQPDVGYINPTDINVFIEADVRTLIVMAAINIAGFDDETGGQPLSPLRAELRRDLAMLDPAIKKKLADYYKANRRAGVDEASDAARYAALSLMMTQPPAFSIYANDENRIPQDLRPLLDFVGLMPEFYIKSGIKSLLPKYESVAKIYASAYKRPVGEAIYQTLDYFHARPEMVINMRPLVLSDKESSGKKTPGVINRIRTRRVYVIPDPFSAMGTSYVRDDLLNRKDELTARRIGDDYITIVGPSKIPNIEPVRQALIRFVIDPIIERHLKTSLEYKDQIFGLVQAVPTAGKEFGSSVYLVIRESLAQAAEARLRRIYGRANGLSYSENDASYDLAQAYLRGSVLAFHFYESLIGLEKVGINIEDFFDQMVATTKFDREARRPKEFEAIVASVSAARTAASARPAASAAEPGGPAVTATMSKILQSDDLIRQRRYTEARPVLEEVLAVEPNNARALYGMAQIVSQGKSQAELDPKADENDRIQAQHDRLEQAMKLYRRAIETASPTSERWLIQWSHVHIGHIYDFQEFRADAIAEYDKAIALGDVPNGAYKEALEGKRQPFGQK